MNIEQQIEEMQQRHAQRVKEAIEKLGTKYLCHPANRVKKKLTTSVLRSNTQ